MTTHEGARHIAAAGRPTLLHNTAGEIRWFTNTMTVSSNFHRTSAEVGWFTITSTIPLTFHCTTTETSGNTTTMLV